MDEKKDVTIDLDPIRTPIFYTDNMIVTTNEDGLIINVGQRVGNSNKLHIITRIGMSRQQAKKFAEKLSKLLALTEGSSQTGKKRN